MRAKTADVRQLIEFRGESCHFAWSSKPGGCEPVAACHAAAAPRWATRRDTEAPTPNEIDQMRASGQPTPRAAGFSGGSWSRLTRQRTVIARRHAAAAAAPDANANISHRRRCTPKSFPSSTAGNPCNRSRRSRIRRRASTARSWIASRAAKMHGRSRCVPGGRVDVGANWLADVGDATDRLSLCARSGGIPE